MTLTAHFDDNHGYPVSGFILLKLRRETSSTLDYSLEKGVGEASGFAAQENSWLPQTQENPPSPSLTEITLLQLLFSLCLLMLKMFLGASNDYSKWRECFAS